jgi:hypothetical protein
MNIPKIGLLKQSQDLYMHMNGPQVTQLQGVHVAGLVLTNIAMGKVTSKMSELKQQNKNVLSEVAREKLRKNAESRQNDSKYIKLASGEKKTLKFDLEGIEQTVVEFNGKKTIRYQYTVVEQGAVNGQQKYLTVGKRTSEEIDAFLLEGQTLLKIQRFGLGKDTRYHVSAA